MKITIPAHNKWKWLTLLLSISLEAQIEEKVHYNSLDFNQKLIQFLLGDKQCIFTIKNIKGDKNLIINTLKKGEKVKIISKSAGSNGLKHSTPGERRFGFIDDIVNSNSIDCTHYAFNPELPTKYIIIVIEGDFFLPKDLKSYD